MRKVIFFLSVILFISISIFIQADSGIVQTRIDRLLEQGFTYELNRAGFNPFVSAFELEYFITYSIGRRAEIVNDYYWIDGNILYEVCFLSKNFANNVVRSRIIIEVHEVDALQETLQQLLNIRKVTFDCDSMYGQYSGKTIYLSRPFYKVNDSNEPGTILITIDGEERLMWF